MRGRGQEKPNFKNISTHLRKNKLEIKHFVYNACTVTNFCQFVSGLIERDNQSPEQLLRLCKGNLIL